MNTKEISSFLNKMFENNVEFANIHGTSSLMDIKTMLVADALSENIELFAEVIKESFNNKVIYQAENQNRVSKFA